MGGFGTLENDVLIGRIVCVNGLAGIEPEGLSVLVVEAVVVARVDIVGRMSCNDVTGAVVGGC
jgi:hypothetical protein